MNSCLGFKKINEILRKCDASIGYTPLPDEKKYTDAPLIKKIFKDMIFLPNNINSDINYWVDKCRNHCNIRGKNICILIPGRQFDIYGTRYGRGGGWYDRFLEKVPKNWIRIGITDKSNLSELALRREVWDEPLDWIMVNDNSSWQIYETNARKRTKK